jgi:hypothetical protein
MGTIKDVKDYNNRWWRWQRIMGGIKDGDGGKMKDERDKYQWQQGMMSND